MLLNFYADWCRYSAALKPIFDQAADAVHSETVIIITSYQCVCVCMFINCLVLIE